MQYFDWDRYDAEGDEAEAAEQGGAVLRTTPCGADGR